MRSRKRWLWLAVPLGVVCAVLAGVAAIVVRELDVERQLTRLDDLAAGAVESAPTGLPEIERVDALSRHLFRGLGFRGNREDYHDPQNSYLHRVLDRRLGLPITLSILLIEVARRLDLTVEGVGTPQHFLVRVAESTDGTDDSHHRYLDPFNGGEAVDRDQLRDSLRQALGGASGHGSPESFLAAVTKRQILTRTLNNLKAAAARRVLDATEAEMAADQVNVATGSANEALLRAEKAEREAAAASDARAEATVDGKDDDDDDDAASTTSLDSASTSAREAEIKFSKGELDPYKTDMTRDSLNTQMAEFEEVLRDKADEIEAFFGANPLPANARKIAQMLEGIRANATFLDSIMAEGTVTAAYWEAQCQ